MKNPIDLVAQAAAFADRYNMLPPGSTILVALSGGGDSMALLSVLEKLARSGTSTSTPPTSTTSCGGRSPSGTRPSSPSGARSGTSP